MRVHKVKASPYYMILFVFYLDTHLFHSGSVSLLLYFGAACSVLILTQLCHFPIINKWNRA